jgi:uncharacterized protein with PIN domain
MTLYVDTSCFAKLFVDEPESERVRDILAAERAVVVSSLTLLELEISLHRLRSERRINALLQSSGSATSGGDAGARDPPTADA